MRFCQPARSISTIATLIFFIFLILVLAIAILKVPFSMPMPDYYKAAAVLRAGLPVGFNDLPVAYIGFLALGMRLCQDSGIFLFQGLLYILTVAMGFFFFRLLGCSHITTLLGSSVLALHPYLLLDIKRIVENNLAVPLLLGFTIVALLVEKYRQRQSLILLWGFLLGLLLIVRTNALTLLGIPLLFFYAHRLTKKEIWSGTYKLCIFLIAMIVTIGTITFAIKGRLLFIPAHGAANFLGGANDFSQESLLSDYNTQRAFWEYVEKSNISDINSDINDGSVQKVMIRHVFQYITQHPFRYMWLSVIKLFTLFRPDYRCIKSNSTISSFHIKVILQTLLATPLLLWLVSIALNKANGICSPSRYIIPLVVLYIIPFLFSSADPRYRLPIDVLMILDSFYRFVLFFRKNYRFFEKPNILSRRLER